MTNKDLIKKMFKNLLYLFLFTNFLVSAYAHGDLHLRISKVTEEIKKHPDSAYLYFKRSALYYQHDAFKESLNDLKKSKKLGLKNNDQIFMFAKSYYELRKYSLSKKYVKKILKKQPANIYCLRLIGKIYYEKRQFEKAAEAFEKVLVNGKETFPENYLEASSAWYSLKTKAGIERGRTLLDEGVEKLGNNIVLFQRLISMAIEQKDYVSAIEYQKRVVEFFPRKERAFLRLAELQMLNGEYSEAELSIKNSKRHFETLPNRIKTTKIMRDFYSEIELRDQELKEKYHQKL